MRPTPYVIAAILAAATVGVSAAEQQIIPGQVVNFRISPEYFPPPHQSQMKSLLEGSQAQPQGDKVLIRDARLQSFRENGAVEIVMQAPECSYDRINRTASSAGPLQVTTADGKFLIQGEGFLWRQTNSSLVISNKVYTKVHPDLLEGRTAGGPRGTNAAPGIEIRSQRFTYAGDDGLGVYSGEVRAAEGTNFSLSSQTLTLKLPAGTRQVQTIIAEGDVRLSYSGVQATGQHGVYQVGTGMMRLTGEPSWRSDAREGRGNELIVDRSNRVFQAVGNAWLKIPSQGGAGLFATPDRRRAKAPPGSFVEIRSDSYEIRTNVARFKNNVRATEAPARDHTNSLTCAELTVFFSGGNELQRILAEREVLIQQDDKSFRAGKAYYTATNGLLNLTDKPSWKAGEREGRGERILVNNPRNEMHVRGNAYLRLPAEELGTPIPAQPAATDKAGEARFGEIYSQEYTVRPEGATFRGGVYASHPRMNWACETLVVESFKDAPLSRRITADQGVSFDLMDEKGEKVHGRGDEAVYTYGVSGKVTNEIVHLRGHPALLETTNATVQNAEIVLDRGQNKLVAPGGKYWIRGTGRPGDTNGLLLPRKR